MASGKRGEAFLVMLLLMVFLASFATHSAAARSHPGLQSLARAALSGFGVSGGEPCCQACICPLIWPPGPCLCAGVWQGSCPSACTNCVCTLNECSCIEAIDAKVCEANSCYALESPAKYESGAKGMK